MKKVIWYFSVEDLNWFFVLGVNLAVISILSATLLLKKLNQPPWRVRKTGHILIHFVLAFLPYFSYNIFDILITGIFLGSAIIILSLIPSVRLLSKVINYATRNGEKNIELIINAILTSLTVLSLYLIFVKNLYIYTAAILTLSLGDGFGEIIGRPYGKIKYKIFLEKSLEGSIAVYVGSCIAITVALLINNLLIPSKIWKIFVGALIATIIEAFNYRFIDNLSVPLATAIFLVLVH